MCPSGGRSGDSAAGVGATGPGGRAKRPGGSAVGRAGADEGDAGRGSPEAVDGGDEAAASRGLSPPLPSGEMCCAYLHIFRAYLVSLPVHIPSDANSLARAKVGHQAEEYVNL